MLTSDPNLRAVLTRLNLDDLPLEPIYGGQSGGRLFRLQRNGSARVLKLLEPAQIPSHLRLGYPQIAETEWRFYTELGPKLQIPLPTIYEAGQLPDGCTFLLMEDLCLHHDIPKEGHQWTDDEMSAVLATYAALHGRSMRLLTDQPIPDWLHRDDRQRFSPESVLSCLKSFYDNDWTQAQVSPLLHSPWLNALLESVKHGLDRQAPSVLFNDFYPPNVALPHDGGPAKLFDWQLVGVGPLQIDIVNIGILEQQDGFAQVDQGRLLGLYLDRLADETGTRLDISQFLDDYRLAALLAWAVFMPRMVAAMHQARAQGKRFSSWMERSYDRCMAVWRQAIEEL